MNQQFQSWVVISLIIGLIMFIVVITLRVFEIIEIRKFKKIYLDSLNDGSFNEKYPNFSGIWEIDKKTYWLIKESKNKEQKLLHKKIVNKFKNKF